VADLAGRLGLRRGRHPPRPRGPRSGGGSRRPDARRRQPRPARSAARRGARLDPTLVARIDSEELLEHGSPEEVEIRARARCAPWISRRRPRRDHRDGRRQRALPPRRRDARQAAPRGHRARRTAC